MHVLRVGLGSIFAVKRYIVAATQSLLTLIITPYSLGAHLKVKSFFYKSNHNIVATIDTYLCSVLHNGFFLFLK